MRESTRLRVERVAGELGYRPDLTASSLRRRRSSTIGVLISSFSNPIYGELLHGISDELDDLGYHVLIAEVPDDRVQDVGGDRHAEVAAHRRDDLRRVAGR